MGSTIDSELLNDLCDSKNVIQKFDIFVTAINISLPCAIEITFP